MSSNRQIDRLKMEIKNMRKMNHPNILKLIDVIDSPDNLYIILEYCASGEYFDFISKQEKVFLNKIQKLQLTEHQAKEYFQQLVSGLSYAHEQGITHRDLKPENILIDQAGLLKIADFGLSSVIVDGCSLVTSCGSPNYAAPEIIENQPYDGAAVDVWSLGIILYASLTGSLPFDSDSMPVLFNQIKKGEFFMPPWFSEDVQDLIVRMLQVNPLK